MKTPMKGWHGRFPRVSRLWKSKASDSESAFLWPVDYPFVQTGTVASLAALSSPQKIIRPLLDNKRGHPPLLGRTFFSAMAVAHKHPDGARGVLQANRSSTIDVEVQDRGILQDVDREGDLHENSF